MVHLIELLHVRFAFESTQKPFSLRSKIIHDIAGEPVGPRLDSGDAFDRQADVFRYHRQVLRYRMYYLVLLLRLQASCLNMFQCLLVQFPQEVGRANRLRFADRPEQRLPIRREVRGEVVQLSAEGLGLLLQYIPSRHVPA
ncbi:hypothetical protein D3C77_587990 [compost metagenome]